jgi:hypothetical protein
MPYEPKGIFCESFYSDKTGLTATYRVIEVNPLTWKATVADHVATYYSPERAFSDLAEQLKEIEKDGYVWVPRIESTLEAQMWMEQ